MTAWELAKEIILGDEMTLPNLEECFGTSDWDKIFAMDFHEALDKYNKWLKRPTHFAVGDLIENKNKMYCITSINDNEMQLIDKNGYAYHVFISPEYFEFKKVAHFNIKELLYAMKFAEDNQDIIVEV